MCSRERDGELWTDRAVVCVQISAPMCKAGGLIVFDYRTIHRSLSPRSLACVYVRCLALSCCNSYTAIHAFVSSHSPPRDRHPNLRQPSTEVLKTQPSAGANDQSHTSHALQAERETATTSRTRASPTPLRTSSSSFRSSTSSMAVDGRRMRWSTTRRLRGPARLIYSTHRTTALEKHTRDSCTRRFTALRHPGLRPEKSLFLPET